MTHPDTLRIASLTSVEAVGSLAFAARGEGFGFLDRLVEEWAAGTQRFEGDGERLLGGFVGDELVATGGLTRQGLMLGRVRRVYVHPAFRRRGIAESIVRDLIAGSAFPTLVLYTETSEAARLYERLGFLPESPDGPDHATHRLRIDPG